MGRYAEMVAPINPEGRRMVCDAFMNMMPDSAAPEEYDMFGDPIGHAIMYTLRPELEEQNRVDATFYAMVNRFDARSNERRSSHVDVEGSNAEEAHELYDAVLQQDDVRTMMMDVLARMLEQRQIPETHIRFCGHLLGINTISTPAFALTH